MKKRFIGSNKRSLDPKGRLILPPNYRQIILAASDSPGSPSSPDAPDPASESGDGEDARFYLTTYDDCLVAYMEKAWQELEDKLAHLANPAPALRNFRRLVVGGAEEQVVDGQGRIRLSPEHRRYASLDKEALVVGVGGRFEIWSPDRYYERVGNIQSEEASEEMKASGLSFDI